MAIREVCGCGVFDVATNQVTKSRVLLLVPTFPKCPKPNHQAHAC